MASPSERLKKIISSYTPSVVKFKAEIGLSDGLFLRSFKTEPFSFKEIEDDKELQAAFQPYIREEWDRSNARYDVHVDEHILFQKVKAIINDRYERYSARSVATKRKTYNFVNSINLINDKHLATFLLQMFVDISKPEFEKKSSTELGTYFESLDLLRRTYGKRS